ncbi:MAG: methylmalonyl Co-A mutase-associated GTPase MeaB [Bacteroidota bacterium]
MYKRRRKQKSAETYVEGILQGDRILLSQAITLVESTRREDRALAKTIIDQCMSHTGNSYRIGITGVPGVGKSTFIDQFGYMLVQEGKKVAVLAIDPSSQVSGGSILGDKTRMDLLSHHPQAYVRPSPTSGSLGGVARKTRETLLLCEAAGFDVVCIETVGVGQSEITVAGMVDFFLLLMLPNAGDDLQGIKKGIMEMADGLVINKAEGEQLSVARKAKTYYTAALRLFPPKYFGWRPHVHLCSALKGEGLGEVWKMLEEFRSKSVEGGFWHEHRQAQAMDWMKETLEQQLLQLFYDDPLILAHWEEVKSQVASGERSPIEAAESLLLSWQTQHQTGTSHP